MNRKKIKITILLVYMVSAIISGVKISNFDDNSSNNIVNNYPRSQDPPATSDPYIKFTAANITGYFTLNGTGGTSWGDAHTFEDLVFPAVVGKTYFEFEATTDYVIFDNCTFINIGKDQCGIFIDNSDNILVNNCRFINCYYGVYAYSGQNSIVDNCTFTDNYKGISFSYYDYSTVIDNYLLNCNVSIFQQWGNFVNIINNEITGSVWGIEIYGGWDNLIENNTISNGGEYGMYLLSISPVDPTLDIINNTFEKIEGSGIYCQMDGVLIENNTLTDISSHGINANKNKIDVVNNSLINIGDNGIWARNGNQNIINNTIINAGDSGIEINPVVGVIIDGNQLYGCGFGLTIPGTNFEITDTNHINGKQVGFFKSESNFEVYTGDDYDQIFVLGCINFTIAAESLGDLYIYDSSNGIATDCVISGIKYAVYLDKGYNITLNNISVTGFDDFGMDLRNSDLIEIIDSAFKENSDTGIMVFSVNNLVITNSEFSSNLGQGAAFSSCENITISTSDFSMNNYEGVRCFSSENTSIEECTANNNTYAGINGGWTRIENNQIRFNGMYGIDISENRSTIKGNIIENNMYAGIELNGHRMVGEDSFVIEANLIKNSESGIRLDNICEVGGFCLLIENEFINCSDGIWIFQGKNYLIQGNSINGSAQGIRIDEATNVTILTNYLISVEWGIIGFSCTGSITGNTITYTEGCIDVESAPGMVASDNTCIEDISGSGFAIPGFSIQWFIFSTILAICLIVILQKPKKMVIT